MKSNLAFDDRFKLDDRFCEDSYDSNEARLKNEYVKRKESIYQRSVTTRKYLSILDINTYLK